MTNLMVAHQYEIVVYGQNNDGSGNLSDIQIITTPMNPPTCIPGDSLIQLNWISPSIHDNVDISYFTIRYIDVSTNVTYDISANGSSVNSNNVLIISDLSNNTPYQFSIMSHSDDVDSIFSAYSSIIIQSLIPLPPIIETLEEGNSQVTITWKDTYYDVSGYILYTYIVISTHLLKLLNTDSFIKSGLSYVKTGLTNENSYKFKMVATNGNDSIMSYFSNVITLSNYPTKPTGLIAVASTDNGGGLYFNWNASNYISGINYYLINVIGGINQQFKGDNKPEYGVFSILLIDTTYIFTVIAVSNDSKQSLPSDPLIVYYTGTTPHEPSKMNSPTLIPGNTQLTISWDIPYNGNSDISGYDIDISGNIYSRIEDYPSTSHLFTNLTISFCILTKSS